MKAAQVLKLHSYNGRMLTRPEILLCQFSERRNIEMKRLADEKMMEKLVLSRISSKLIVVPSVKVSVPEVKIEPPKVDEAEATYR
jgi:hypothetical protein